MPNPREKWNWQIGDFESFLQYIQLQSGWPEESIEISDSTFKIPSEIIDFPLEIPFYKPISSEKQDVIEDLDIAEYKKQFTDSLLQLIREEIFEFGMENAADTYVQENLRDNPFVTKELLNSLFLDYFTDIGVTTGLLRIIAHLDYEDINPTGPIMALAALSHQNTEVRECAIRAFENWCHIDSLDYLKAIKCNERWLQTYLDKVISDFEELYAIAR